MLFYLTDSLIVDRSDETFAAIKRAIRLLAMSVFECKHLLRGDENVLKYFESEFVGDDDTYSVLHYLVERPSTANVVPEEICNYVEVINGDAFDTVKEGHHIKQICYKYFCDSSKVQAMRIAVEDIDDSKFYGYVLRWYLDENELKYNYAFTPLSGGGKRMDVIVTDILSRGLMVTCIADSDKKYRNQPDDTDSTSYKCSKIKCSDGIYFFLLLAVHELENLIPHNHFSYLKWTGQSLKDKNDFAHLCGKTESEQILPYFDIKEGIKKKDVLSLGQDYYNFAESCCKLNPALMRGKSFHDYVNGLPSDDSSVYPRLRKRMMNDLASLYEKRQISYPKLMLYQFDEWNKIAQIMLDVTCAKNSEAMM